MSTTVRPLAEVVREGDPLVSCIVPLFNKAAYLKETVDSLLSQQYQNLEIIIVDDGSTDNSAEAARDIIRAQGAGKIRLLQKGNGGVSDARNFGIKEAKGRVILCIDADDLADPSFIAKGIAAMRQFGSNLICSDVQLFGTEITSWQPEPYDPYFIRYNNCIPTMALFDRDLWVKTGGYKVAIPFAEDWEFFINCSRYDLSVTKINEKLFKYRRTDAGLLTNYLKDKWTEPAALMMLANSDLYNIEDLAFAQKTIMNVGENWRLKLVKQDALHPNEWLLKFLLAAFAQQAGNIQQALELYAKAIELTAFKNWLPVLRIAEIVEGQGNTKAANDLYHQVRTLRPDMHFRVGAKADLRGK